MNEGSMQASRERDIPEKMSRLGVQVEGYAKLLAELRERTKPIASPAPTVAKDTATPSTPGLTPLGVQLMESINRMCSLNESLEDIIRSLEV